MGITAFKNLLVFGQRPPPGTGASGSENPDLCPSAFWAGVGFIDGRVGYNVTRLGAIMAYGSPIIGIDAVPSTISAVNISAAALAVTGTPLTLVSSTAAGITVLSAAQQVWASGNTVPAAALAIDGASGLTSFGTALPATGNTRMAAYDPTTMLARNVRITSAGGNDTSAVFTVAGYDVYGYPMSEAITGANAGVASGAKAFKYITSITPSGTIGSTTVSVGTGDVYGLPVFASTWGYLKVVWTTASTATLITAETGFTAGVTTTATTTTGDVRGTYATQSASNNSRRLTVFITPSAANCNSLTGLWGVTQA